MSSSGFASSLEDDELPLSSSLSVLSEFSDSAKSEPMPEDADERDEKDKLVGGTVLHVSGDAFGLLLLVVALFVGERSFAIAGESTSSACSVLLTRPYPIATKNSNPIGNITSKEFTADVLSGWKR